MNRRQFLKQSAALSGIALAATTGCSKLNLAKHETTVGTHIWVYAKHQPNYDVSNILPQIWADVKYAGIGAIELMEQPLRREDKTQEIAALIEEFSLPLIGTSYGANFWQANEHNKIYEDLDNILDNMQSLKARTLGISVRSPSGGRLKTEAELDAQAELIARVNTLSAPRGVTLNLHNHTYEVANDLHDLAGTLERLPEVKLGPDLNWLKRAGVDPIWFLNKFKDNIVFMHIRDQDASGRWSESLGEGDVDFTSIAATVREISFEGDIIIELAHEDGFTPTRPIKESLKMSREFVRETFGV